MALVVLTLSSVVTAVTAVAQRNRAEEQTRVANEQTRIATAGELLASGRAAITTDPKTALMLGEAAQLVHDDQETRFGLAQLVRSTRYTGTATGHVGYVRSVAFAPHRDVLATGSADGSVLLWDLRDRAHPQPLEELRTYGGDVFSVAFSPDGNVLAAGSSDGTVRVWGLDGPSPVLLGDSFKAHGNRVSSVAFSPDGRTLATSSWDTTVCLWDVTNPTHLRRIGQPCPDMQSPRTPWRSPPTDTGSPLRAPTRP